MTTTTTTTIFLGCDSIEINLVLFYFIWAHVASIVQWNHSNVSGQKDTQRNSGVYRVALHLKRLKGGLDPMYEVFLVDK